MGQNALLQGDSDEAIQYFIDAYNLEKSNFTALSYLAAAYYMIGERQKAVTTLRDANDIDASRKAEVDKLIQDIQAGTFRL